MYKISSPRFYLYFSPFVQTILGRLSGHGELVHQALGQDHTGRVFSWSSVVAAVPEPDRIRDKLEDVVNKGQDFRSFDGLVGRPAQETEEKFDAVLRPSADDIPCEGQDGDHIERSRKAINLQTKNYLLVSDYFLFIFQKSEDENHHKKL